MTGRVCDFCGRDVMQDEGHYEAKDEDKTMCVQCYDDIVEKDNGRND